MEVERSPPRVIAAACNTITFSEADREVRYTHNRPLYITVIINGLEVRRALVDTSASSNFMPLNVLRQLGIPENKIIRKCVEMTGFSGSTTNTIGYVQVDVQAEKLCGPVMFYVADVDSTYHVLLGRMWLNANRAIPSTYHQCIKTMWKGRETRIPTTRRPFSAEESHMADASYFDEVADDVETRIVRPVGLRLPTWRQITQGGQGEPSKVGPLNSAEERELIDISDEEIQSPMIVPSPKNEKDEGMRKRQKGRWERIIRPDGKIVYRL